MDTLLTYLPLGLDSFAVCIGLGALRHPLGTWLGMALAFGFADGLGTALGMTLGENGAHLPAALAYLAPSALILYGILVAATMTRLQWIISTRIGLIFLPLVLSLDNIAAAALGEDGPATAVAILSSALTTSIMALLGCIGGAILASVWPSLRRVLPSAAPIAAALVMTIS